MGAADLREALSAHFAPDDIEWRIGQAGKKDGGEIWAKAFAYITNRAIQDRLDAVVGPENWRNEYRPWEIGTPGVLCGLSLKIDGEWVTKWDGAEQTDMEAMKGGLSGAMKRAAVQWGIGRYLYDLPEGWAKVGPQGRHFASQAKIKVAGKEERVSFKWDPPDLPKWALPTVAPAAPAPLSETRVAINKLLPGLTPDIRRKVEATLAKPGADELKVLARITEMQLTQPAGGAA
jgi:hypothetical protein